MSKASIKRTVFDWVTKNSSAFEGMKVTNKNIADKFMRFNPQFKASHSIETVLKYVTKTRSGEITPDDFNDIESAILENIEAAQVFTVREKELDLNPLDVLPDMNKLFFDVPETYANHPAPLKLDGYGKKLGIISDIHFPIHDRPAVLAAHAHLKAENIDCLLLLGDVMDTSNLTRHAHRQSLSYTWREELEVARAYIKSLRVLFPNIPIVYEQGNHEKWMQQYLVRQASQLEGDYILQERLKLEEYNVEWVDEYQLMTFGDLFLHHGHMLGVSGGRNVATRILDKHGVNLLVGHYHRMMTDEKTNLDGRLHAVWINGCLADQHPSYNPYGNSTHGCSIVHLREDERFYVEQFKILNGRIIG